MEGAYSNPDGTIHNVSFDAELLAADERMRWDPGAFGRFPAARSPDEFWPGLLSRANRLVQAGAPTDELVVSYQASYSTFRRMLAGRQPLTSDQLFIAAGCAYAWMPRVLRLDPAQVDAALSAINLARRGAAPDVRTIGSVARFLRGSVVGASKLLHFAVPERYAIWDRRVAFALGVRRFLHTGIEAEALYLAYLVFCDQMLSYPQGDELHVVLSPLLGADVSRLRMLEYVLFTSA